MTTVALNNLWTYLQGLSLKRADREWLAGKLVEPATDDVKTKRQKKAVKDSLYRALDEVEAAQTEGKPMMTEADFLNELKNEGLL